MFYFIAMFHFQNKLEENTLLPVQKDDGNLQYDWVKNTPSLLDKLGIRGQRGSAEAIHPCQCARTPCAVHMAKYRPQNLFNAVTPKSYKAQILQIIPTA